MTTEISGFERSLYRHGVTEHPVYGKGQGRGVVIMHELPGMTPSCIDLARRIAGEHYRVFLPLLFGQPNQRSPLRNLARICMGREFGLLSSHGSSPITDWLRALCREVHSDCGGPGVGLCFTGNLAFALIEAIEIDSSPGNPHGIGQKAHSVLTQDFVDREGHPTRLALERVLGFLRERLGIAEAPA